MEKNIKVWRKQVLKSQEPSFFMVNQAWVDQNMKFCDKHGLLIEYPEVEDYEQIEKDYKEKMKSISKKQKKEIDPEKEIEIENNQNEIDNEETK